MEVQFEFANRMTDEEIAAIREQLGSDDPEVPAMLAERFHDSMESMRIMFESESQYGLARYSYRLVSDDGEVVFEGPRAASD